MLNSVLHARHFLFSSQTDDSSRAKSQDERARLVEEHKKQLQHMRSEYESKLADHRAKIERDLGIRINSEIEKARNGWEKEQHDARCAINKTYVSTVLSSLASVDVNAFLVGFSFKSSVSRKQDKRWKMPDVSGKNNSDKK